MTTVTNPTGSEGNRGLLATPAMFLDGADAGDPVGHLHFDRVARTWLTPADVPIAVTLAAGGAGLSATGCA